MNRKNLALLTALTLAAAGARAESRIIDLQKLIAETGFDKKETQEMADLQKELMGDIQKVEEAMVRLQTELNDGLAGKGKEGEKIKSMKDEAREKWATDLQLKIKHHETDLNSKRASAQQKFQKKQAELQGRLFKKLREYASQLLNDKVTEIKDPSGAIIAYAPSVDATDNLVAIVKEGMKKDEDEVKKTIEKKETKAPAKKVLDKKAAA